MARINLLKSLPQTKRSKTLLEERAKLKLHKEHTISRLYGYDYFDGHRRYGYGGYKYDGRWIKIAKDIIKHYNLPPGARILDVGAAKGYLVLDLLNQGMDAVGVDISKYALKKCPTDVIGRMHYGDIIDLHFPDNSFDLVLALNVLHNLHQGIIYLGFKEIQRVSKKHCFITVDAYRTEEERLNFEKWCLTARTYGPPPFWAGLFAKYSYYGDYDLTIHEFSQ